MSFEIIRNATREVLGEADTLEVAVERAVDFARQSAEVVVRNDDDGEYVATVWHDGMVEITYDVDDPAVGPQSQFYAKLLGLETVKVLTTVRR